MCTTGVPADQGTADERGSRFIQPEAPDERNDTMSTYPDDIIPPGDIFDPDPQDIDALLDRAANPPQRVIESPLEMLAGRVLLKVDEFAEIMRIDVSTAYKMIRAGSVDVAHVGENGHGIRVKAQPLARMLGAECPHCGEIGGA